MKEREKTPLPLLLLPLMFEHFEGGGGDRCAPCLCAPAPTHASHPCSHPLQFCICPCPLLFLPTVVCAHSYLLPMRTLGHLIHGLHTFIQVCPCPLSFLPAVVCTRSLFVPVHSLYLFIIHTHSYLLAARTLGCPIHGPRAFIWVCFCTGPCPLSFLPTVICTRCCSCLFLPTSRVHSQSSMLMLSALVRVCTCPLLLAVILCITYHT